MDAGYKETRWWEGEGGREEWEQLTSELTPAKRARRKQRRNTGAEVRGRILLF